MSRLLIIIEDIFYCLEMYLTSKSELFNFFFGSAITLFLWLGLFAGLMLPQLKVL